MSRFLNLLETVFAAAAFAEHNEPEEAASLLAESEVRVAAVRSAQAENRRRAQMRV